jgi:protein-S-isoprenylcysteine O-methyltransferase
MSAVINNLGDSDGAINSPPSQHPLSTNSTFAKADGGIPNTPLAVTAISFVLGTVFFAGVTIAIYGPILNYWWSTFQLGFFVAAWALFHWLEFGVTAGWNLEKCSVDSFLLNNGLTYHAANGTALLEHVITLYFAPELKTYPYISLIGIFVVVAGQALRSTAMVHASTNFSHSLEYRKRPSHTLVTSGVYRFFRHPSYAGFFYWALGTQLVLQNPISFIAFSILLWRFFYYRTRSEEAYLIRFFGNDYIQYRKRVGTKIPFVP